MQDITGLGYVAFYNAGIKFWVIIVQDEAGNQVNARYQFVNKRHAYNFVMKNYLVPNRTCFVAMKIKDEGNAR